MAVFKCKICGAPLEIEEDTKTIRCEYCNSVNSITTQSDEKIMNMYERANHFRRINEYDKAANIYEQILTENSKDAQAYWSIVLCRYGVVYVEDPLTKIWLPTINRMQNKPILIDEDYQKALEYADVVQKATYIEQANKINDIQKHIHQVMETAEDYDIFICYKKTDENGKPTRDSVYASELYQELEKAGYKTFFAQVTLLDKGGVDYEPYIFKALQSAKIMIVMGSKKEYFEAPWVKNEWSRYLSLMKDDKSRYLIPAYRDMDPYDLPEEFAYKQAQDMGKISFLNDLLVGIKRILPLKKPQEIVSTPEKITQTKKETTEIVSVENLENRVKVFLESGDYKNATIYCDKILDLQYNNAFAYVGKLLAAFTCKNIDELSKKEIQLADWAHYKNALKFATNDLKEQLEKTCKQCLWNIVSARIADLTIEDFNLSVACQNNPWPQSIEKILAKYREYFRRVDVICGYLEQCKGYLKADEFYDYYSLMSACFDEFDTEEFKITLKHNDYSMCLSLLDEIKEEDYGDSFLKNLKEYLVNTLNNGIESKKKSEEEKDQNAKRAILAVKNEKYDLAAKLEKEAMNQLSKGNFRISLTIMFEAITTYKEIDDYSSFRDVQERITRCEQVHKKTYEKLYVQQRAKEKKKKLISLIVFIILLGVNALFNALFCNSFTSTDKDGNMFYFFLVYIVGPAALVWFRLPKKLILLQTAIYLVVGSVSMCLFGFKNPYAGTKEEVIISAAFFAALSVVITLIAYLVMRKIENRPKKYNYFTEADRIIDSIKNSK